MAKGNMKSTLTGALLALLVVLSISTKTVRGDDPSCPNVQLRSTMIRLGSCALYLIGKSTAPTEFCCPTYHDLNAEASTPEKRKVLCDCFKRIAVIDEYLKKQAESLPIICKLPNAVLLSPDNDCSKIN